MKMISAHKELNDIASMLALGAFGALLFFVVLLASGTFDGSGGVSLWQALRPNYASMATATMSKQVFPTTALSSDYADLTNIESSDKIFGIAAGGGTIRHDQAYLDGYFRELNDLGVTWIRTDVDWSVIQPDSKEVFNWSEMDRFVTTAQKYNIHVLGIITYTPIWARSAACASSYRCPPADPDLFGTFAGAVAGRYKGAVNTWEIWNEPNMAQFWASGPDVDAYGKLLTSAYTNIKSTNSRALILSAGLASVGNSSSTISSFAFISALYNKGYQKYFDAIALHPYTYPASINYQSSWNSWLQMKKIRQVMVRNGDAYKYIWISEFGAPTNGSGRQRSLNQNDSFVYGSDYLSENSQKQLVASAANAYIRNSTWIRGFFVFNLYDDSGSVTDVTPSTEMSFGLVRADGSPKPAYNAFKTIIDKAASSSLSVTVLH